MVRIVNGEVVQDGAGGGSGGARRPLPQQPTRRTIGTVHGGAASSGSFGGQQQTRREAQGQRTIGRVAHRDDDDSTGGQGGEQGGEQGGAGLLGEGGPFNLGVPRPPCRHAGTLAGWFRQAGRGE
jgi:hypothetical protein